MKTHSERADGQFRLDGSFTAEHGFSLAEFLISSAILMIVAGSVFGLLSQTQRSASFQVEMQNVMENTRFAMMTLERILQQAGNDPLETGFQGISEIGSAQVRVQADLTGSGSSATPAEPDKGDPDGDTTDAGEDVTISYDADGHEIELNGQPIVSNIYGFDLQYYDKNGATTGIPDSVTKMRATITGQSSARDPQTGTYFSMQLGSDIKLLRPVK
jgi:Tfp pilus assembly protein PilV